MAENVPVRCPVCRREHAYAPPVYPCPCGAPVSPPLLRGGIPVRVQHRTWRDSWISMRCPACGRREEWPCPELGCSCGATLRLPVDRAVPGDGAAPAPPGPPAPPEPSGTPGGPPAAYAGPTTYDPLDPYGPPDPHKPPPYGLPGSPGPDGPLRAPFEPVTIRTAQDAVTAAAHYLRWLGYVRVRVTGNQPVSGIDLRGPEVLARVDPTTAPVCSQTVETLWLHGLNESAVAVCFSLAGYEREARTRADTLGLPLFVLDLTGTPQPVNDAAEQLVRTGA